MDIILERCETTERKNSARSALISGGLITVLFALGWIWVTMFPQFFPVKKKEYVEVAMTGFGLADFGNNVNGSGNVNNFRDPSPNPGEGTPGHSATQAEAASPASVAETPPVTTTSHDAPEVQAVGPNPSNVPSNPTPVKPDDTDHSGTGGTDTGTGSNHGNSDVVGNRGNPDAHVLNNDGTFAFGSTMGNRKYIDLPRPVYTAQQEAKLTFEFIIAPDGHVKYVKGPVTQHTSLKQAGMDAIYKWKFDAADDGQDLKSQVTITFRLK